MTCVIGIDIGTTSTIGILLDTKKNRIIKKKSIEVDLFSIKEGWAEEDPNQWWRNTKEIIRDLSKFAKLKNKKIISIGTTGMLPALVILNNQGRAMPSSDIRFINAAKFAENLIKRDQNLREEALAAAVQKGIPKSEAIKDYSQVMIRQILKMGKVDNKNPFEILRKVGQRFDLEIFL